MSLKFVDPMSHKPAWQTSRLKGDKLIIEQAQNQVQTFFDEFKNKTQNYRTISSLGEQIAQDYRGRCILELLQNAHDALPKPGESDDPRIISFVLTTSPEPVLLIGNSGHPFHTKDFKGLCQLGQSPKHPDESVGNKGLGFRSVLEVCSCPEIWSTTPPDSDTSFVFRFDPAVIDRVVNAANALRDRGLSACSPFDPQPPLVDWSKSQLEQYRSITEPDAAKEARRLSPYLFPLTAEGVQPEEVASLLDTGHVTVVRLRLDGGKNGDPADAVQAVKDQLEKLDARSMVFLSRLGTLAVEVDGERRTLERIVDSDEEFVVGKRSRQQRLLVRNSGAGPGDDTTQEFHMWTLITAPEQAAQISEAVAPLPNRWPEVHRVEVSVAVQEPPAEGVFVVFLPTEMTTGTGAHINAPFYSKLDRRRIDFSDPYNKLLLDTVLDLCLDVAAGLVSRPSEDWCARAVIDLLSSTATVSGESWRFLDKLHERAAARECVLNDLALILCDRGWRIPDRARIMPDISEDSPIGAEQWREYAEFEAVSMVLDGRRAAVKALLTKLNGSLSPTDQEWKETIERVAKAVKAREVTVTWDTFLNGLLKVLPENLRSNPKPGSEDPLAKTRFLPTEDGRLLSASDTAKLFFRPVRGMDDTVDLVEEIPDSLKSRVAFLHQDVRTQEVPQHRNTDVQKFLDGRFARTFRREDLLRDVVVPALPSSLPVPHDSPEASRCAELFSWTLKVLGEDEPDSLLPLFKRLPVACHGG